MKFSEKLIKLRKQKGISQEELADYLDVSRQSVYKWEAGTNMPDIAKIEKMTKYFGVTFDHLLNEENESFVGDEKKEETAEPLSFRDVFVSSYLPDPEQSNYEHGCVPGRIGRIKDAGDIFNENKEEFERQLLEKKYTNVVMPQYDLCLCYFEDEENKTFGFYYEGCEQFVCPFENFLDFHVTTDGYRIGYNQKGTILSVGTDGSFGMGRVAQASLEKPSTYTLAILYRDHMGKNCEYTLSFYAQKYYLACQASFSKNLLHILWDQMSESTQKGLDSVVLKLKGLPARTELIRTEKNVLPPVDVEAYRAQSEQMREEISSIKEEMKSFYQEERRQKRIIKVVGVLVAVAAVAGALVQFF